MTTHMRKLKQTMRACPFCGFKAELRRNGEWWQPICSNYDCGARLPECGSVERAIDDWNKRSRPVKK